MLSNLNRLRKEFTREAQCFLMRLFYRKKSVLRPESYRNVCLLMQDHGIGDAIVVSGLIKLLKEAGRTVVVVTNPRSEAIFTSMVPNDGLMVWSKDRHKSVRRKSAKQGIDLVIDLSFYPHYNKRHRMGLISAIRPAHAIGFNGNRTALFDTSIPTCQTEHVTERMKRVLECLQISVGTYHYAVSFDDGIVHESTTFIERARKTYDSILVLNPFGASIDRCLASDQIKTLCDYLDSLQGVLTIVFDLGRNVNTTPYVNVIKNPFSDLDNSFNLVRHADLVITVDTSVVHLAAAFDVPQYAIYNNRVTAVNDNNIVWGPNNKNAIQLTTLQKKGLSGGDDITQFDVSVIIDELGRRFEKADSLGGKAPLSHNSCPLI